MVSLHTLIKPCKPIPPPSGILFVVFSPRYYFGISHCLLLEQLVGSVMMFVIRTVGR